MTLTPAEARLQLAGAFSGGRFSPNGLRNFQLKFATPESIDEFLKWRDNPVTLAYLGALRGLMATPPAGYVPADSVELQFGVQSGLALAAQLVDDPTSLYPSLFSSTSGRAVESDEMLTEYSVAPDHAG